MRVHTEKGPAHVGLIMDGNGRWATSKALPRSAGHLQGAKALEAVIKEAPKLGIKELSAYVFSTENWTRDESEVAHIMMTFLEYLMRMEAKAIKEGVRVLVVGDRYDNRLPAEMLGAIERIESVTRKGNRLKLNLAFNYGGESDILHGVSGASAYAKAHGIDPSKMSSELLRQHLFSAEVPDMDLLIRTGGEYRLSNFFPIQTRYAELYFTSVCWPDFHRSHS